MHSRLPLFRREFLFVLCLVFISVNIYSQNWLKGEGGVTNDEALDVASDSSGNYYITGYFTSAATIGTIILNSSGNSDVFIAKYNAAGAVQWALKAGGSGADRAYSIKADDAGNVYVTGYYYGTATFGSSTISSVAGSQDVFIAKYNTSGILQWVKSVGGTDAETGYGITSDHDGNVIVTGQFKGAATFGTTTLSSTINPITTLPSFDIFTVKFDGNGNFLWVEQGLAKYDDRGLDVAVDLLDNIFIVGQFSDTILFDVIHNNAVMNSGYLMKYDPSGNEQWLIKMSAVQTILYSVAVDQSNNILITGDFKGNLGIFTTPIVYNTSAFSNKIFIAKFSNSGSLIWVENDGSDSEITSKSIALDKNDDAYITGLFKCRFDEYSQTIGTGVFYSSGYRDVFVTKYSSAGARQWIRHFGSNKDDYCSGITVKTIDKPVITGSFENRFNIPYSQAFTSFSENIYTPGQNYCGNNDYQIWISQQTSGHKDIFITSPVDASVQQHFDYFKRSGSVCNQNFRFAEIDCQFGISYSGLTISQMNVFQIDTQYIGPRFNYQWNTASIDDTSHIASPGWYWVTAIREDACYEEQDTVYANIPLITDSYSINVNQPRFTTPIKVCGKDTLMLWGTHAINPDTVYWNGPQYIPSNDSTINAFQNGTYTYTIVGQGGCVTTNAVNVVMDTFAIHDVLNPHIIFSDSILQATDTIRICENQQISVKVIDSAFYGINGDMIPFKTVDWHIAPAGTVSSSSTYSNHSVSIGGFTTGMYSLIDTLYNYCGDSIVYPLTRNFYVIVNPKPTISLSISGPSNSCPGDSVFLIANSNVSPFGWSNGLTINALSDTMGVLAPSSGPVLYQIAATHTDTITGCSNSGFTNFILYARPYPIVTMSPTNGIICPNDSVLLTCEPGLNYYWIGPNGDSIGTTQSIYVNVPGFYHCIHTSFDACIQTSNFVEAKQYNTPYLVVLPGNVICANGNAVISVQASNSASIQWQPPLNGSASTQTVTAAGTYICEITECGITTIDSIVIVQSTTPSIITSSDSMICPGDTLVLHGNPGMDSYQWISETSSDPFLYVTAPGSYILQTMDIYGCYGFSAPYIVSALPQAVAPTATDTSICAGQSISISASGPGSIAWYNSGTGGTPFYLGNTYLTPLISSNTTYYLRTLDSICSSPIIPVNVNVYTSSIVPTFSGDTTLCVGDSLGFVANNNGVNYTWTAQGVILGTLQSFSISSVSIASQGYYTLQYSDAMCISPIDSFYVTINPIPTPHISLDSIIYICSGTTTVLSIDSIYSSYSWSQGGQTNQSITVNSAGMYFGTVTQNGCIGTSNTITVSYSNPLPDPIASDVSVCSGNPVTLTAMGAGILTWYDSALNLVGTGTTYTISSADSNAVYFVKNIDTAGCSSQLVQVNVFVTQDSASPTIYNTSPVCSGEDIYLSTDLIIGATYSWTGPVGFSSTQLSPIIFSAQLSNIGLYQLVVSLNGCVMAPGTTTIEVKPVPSIPVFSTNLFYCEEDSLHIEISNSFPGSSIHWTSPIGSIISDTNYIDFSSLSLVDNGTYHLSISNNGCNKDTAFNIAINPKPLAVENSNSPICTNDTLQLYADIVPGATYHWNGPAGYLSTNQSNFILNANSSVSGLYQLTVTLNGCISDTAQIEIHVIDFPIIDLGLDTAFCLGTSVVFTMPQGYIYLWNNGSTNETYTATDSGTVIVRASIAPGCITTDSVHVDDYYCLSNVPNFITPNGDGINDNLYFNTEGIRAINVNLYDRWGREIYHWNDLNGYWNGRNLNNTPVVTGVYFYVVNITGYDYKTHEYKGFVHVQN